MKKQEYPASQKMLDELKEYFANTPREKVLEDWAKAREMAPKNSIKLKDFLNGNST